MEETAIIIRPAEIEDAEAIVRVHFSAVHGTASACYPAEVIQRWSPEPCETRWVRLRKRIAADDERIAVAQIGGIVCGWGSVVPAEEQLEAIFVAAEFGRRGVGSAILKYLEETAANCGVRRLSMNASLNAEAFYRKHGYAALELGIHRLNSGVEMVCVKMTKRIA